MSTEQLLDPAWCPRAREDVVFRRVGEEWVLFDPEAQRIHVLNLTAALVWSFCTGDHDVPSIEGQVRTAFEESVDDAGVVAALNQFRDASLVQ